MLVAVGRGKLLDGASIQTQVILWHLETMKQPVFPGIFILIKESA